MRLAPDDDVVRATARLRARQPHWREETLPDYRSKRLRDEYLREPLTAVSGSRGASFLQSRYRAPVLTLQAATALVFLIACGNVASLLLAKAPGRRRELGIRAALGASRVQLFRQLIAEASLLSALALPLAVLLSVWVSRLLVARASPFMFLDVALDAKALAFTAALGGVTTLLVGSLPAWRASREDPTETIRLHGSGSDASTPRVGRALVPVQVALSLVLLTTASLFVRSWLALSSVSLGFAPAGAWIVEIDASRSPRRDDLPQLHESVLEAARRAVGVASAGTSALVPIGGMVQITIVDLPQDAALTESERTVQKNFVSPGWFEALRTPLVAGRTFAPADRGDAPDVAIVNEAFVARLLPRGAAVGEEIREVWNRNTEAARPLRIVGVVKDTKFRSIKEPAAPTLYRPVAQLDEHDRVRPVFYLTARSAVSASSSPSTLPREIVRAVEATDPDLSLSIRSMEDQVRATYWREETMAELAAGFGALGLVLTMLGVVGVTGQVVARRRRDLAIRLALGAESGRLARAVLSRTLALVLAGTATGIAASTWTAGLLESMLFDVAPNDPRWLGAAAALLVATSAVATWIPARRVLRLDPSSLLRQE